MRSMFRVVRYTFSVALKNLEFDMGAHADHGSFCVTLVVDGVLIDLFEEVTKSQASGWVEAEDYKMPPVLMHFYRLVTLDSFFGHCCFLIIFRSVCLQLIGLSEWELLDKYM